MPSQAEHDVIQVKHKKVVKQESLTGHGKAYS